MPFIQHQKTYNFLKDNIVALSSSHSRTTSPHIATPKLVAKVPARVAAPPGLLRCIIVSWSDQRADFFREAAERESWETIVCKDVGQFMRSIFQVKVPLTIVDLPEHEAEAYLELRQATERSREVSDSLLVVSVHQGNTADELWARQLGVWAHLPEASSPPGLEMIFREARKAVAKQATAYMELNGPRGNT